MANSGAPSPRMPVYFRPQMVAPSLHRISRSSEKPRLLMDRLASLGAPIDVIDDFPSATREDFLLAHSSEYVDAILTLKADNGFSNRSPEICDSLYWTTGSMLAAARGAIDRATITLSPTSGFHHALYDSGHGYCTFNGLMVAATALIREGRARRVAIIDADYHYGNGTDHILRRSPLREQIFHFTFGDHFAKPSQAQEYLAKADALLQEVVTFDPDLVIYQAGADVHVDDYYHGLLSTDQIIERERLMFRLWTSGEIPMVWNLAGGYQFDANDQITPVIDLHMITVHTALAALGDRSPAS